MKQQTWPPSLTQADRAMFERFKIPADLVKDARIPRVTDKDAREKWYVSAPTRCSLAGLVFPYPSPENESEIRTCRVRLDKPEVVAGKTKNKYMAPKGGPRCLYRPPGAREKLNSQDTIIVLVESEKAALAGTAWTERCNKHNILFVGMGGCWGWSQDKAPLSDMEVCRNRVVNIMLDANAATNAEVQKARTALATALRKLDCDVRIADTPQMEGVNGPDDLLALEDGDSRLEAALAAARPAVVAAHSDDALAARFAEQHKDDVRYVKALGSWFVWDGQRWKQDETERVARLVQAMCEVAAAECASPAEANRVRRAGTRKAVQQEASVYGRLAATVDLWDADPWVLNTPGGVVDLRTGKLRPAAREDYCTKMTQFTPEQKKPVRWLQFLKEIMEGKKELPDYLQRVAGYFLTANTQEHAMFFLYGTGANGKSVFVNTITGILGDYAKTAAMDTFTVSHNERHPTELARLRGARLVTATETEDGQRWAEAKLKQITGGDKIAARFIQQNFFEYTPQFKLLLSGNYKPRLRNVDEAMRRRMHLIPFDVTIPPERRDPKLAEKLRAEWGGILQWMIEGCVAWRREGLTPPPAVTGATDEYLREQDAVRRWLEEETEEDPNGKEQPSTFYRAYKRWAEAAGEWVPSQNQFSQKLAAHGYESMKSHGTRTIRGLKLRLPKFAGAGVGDGRKSAGGKLMVN